MSKATQVYYATFDAVFFSLSPAIQGRIESAVDKLGVRLDDFPHHRLKSSNRFRLRVGDYRVIYTFNVEQNTVHLLALGHRREIYQK